MNVYVYLVFRVFPDGSRDLCGIFCKPEDAKRHCNQHPPIEGVKYFAVARAPLWGFPWLLIGAVIALALMLGHML